MIHYLYLDVIPDYIAFIKPKDPNKIPPALSPAKNPGKPKHRTPNSVLIQAHLISEHPILRHWFLGHLILGHKYDPKNP